MSSEEANEIIKEAAREHGKDPEDLWEYILKNIKTPYAAGRFAAHKKLVDLFGQAIEAIEAAGREADPVEMAEALREEIKERAAEHKLVNGHGALEAEEMIEASYIWCRGETNGVSMETELSFGQYEDQTIEWLFENDRDYANWIVSEMKADRPHLATFIALEEDRRRKESDDHHVEWRGDECIPVEPKEAA